jgi:hypothetical protein
VICAVQVLMARILDLQGFRDIARNGDLASPKPMTRSAARDHRTTSGSSVRMTPRSSSRGMVG